MYISAFKNYNASGIFSYRFIVHGTLFKLDQFSKFPYLVVYKKLKMTRYFLECAYFALFASVVYEPELGSA